MNSARLAQVKAAYRIVFGYPVPYAVYQVHEPDELVILLDNAIRNMEPLEKFKPYLVCSCEEARFTPLPLSARALARWQYMRRNHRLAGKRQTLSQV